MKKLIILLSLIVSCTVYKQPKPQITHVLAVTQEGDTLKMPINSIKPNVIYNVIGYDYYRPYNYNYYWRPYNHNYKPNNNTHGNSNYNNNSSNNTPTNTTPTVKPVGSVTPPNPVIVNPRKNN